jgi:hypothetical protein
LINRDDSSKIAPQKYLSVAFEHWYRGPKQDTCGNGVGARAVNAMRWNGMGKLMKKLVIVMMATAGVASAAVAADIPVRQPPPPTPVVGKAPIGKAPIGKGPIGKGPIGKGPVVAPPPIVTRG